MARVRLTATERRAIIVKAAVDVMRRGTVHPSLADVAEACAVDTSPGTVRHYFPTVSQLRTVAAKADPDVMKACRDAGVIK